MSGLRTSRLVTALAAAAWLGAVGVPALAQAPALDEQVRQIAAELRCPVCQNLSVADSPSTLAQEMRGLIREQLEQGKTRDEVLAYFVSKYGEWVLLTPKPTGFNLLVYVVPFLGGAAGVAGVLLVIPRWVRRRRERAEAVPEVSAADRERLRQVLAAEEDEEPGSETAAAPGPLAELEAKRAALCKAIRELDLDHQAGMISAEDYGAMRRRYEAEAVAILSRLDALRAETAAPSGPGSRGETVLPAAAAAAVSRARARSEDAEEIETGAVGAARGPGRPAWMVAGGLALVAFGVAGGALLTYSIQPRPEGGSITGSPLTGATREMPPMGSASTTEPGKAGQGQKPLDPATGAQMLRAAHEALDAGRLQEASSAYRAVLERDPRNVEALTHMGNILERSGEQDGALHVYDKALEIDPRYLHALWDKGHLLFQRADYAGAIKAWQAFFETARPGPDRDHAEQRMADARARLTISGPVPPAEKQPPQSAPRTQR